MRRNTTRHLLLTVLANYPEGISSKRLFTESSARKAISEGALSVFVSKEQRTGLIKTVGKNVCSSCGCALLRYAITDMGRAELMRSAP